MENDVIFPLLNRIYYTTKDPGSFSGINKLYERAKIFNKNITRDDVKQFLNSQETYTLHRFRKKKFVRNPIRVYEIDHQWQVDLLDIRNEKKWNNNMSYILVVIDIFSKFIFAEPLPNKKPSSVVAALTSIFVNRKPKILQMDSGKEFKNKLLQKFLLLNDVQFFYSENKTKCSVVERVNRTLREKIRKIVTYTGEKNFIQHLYDIVDSYNTSYHRSLKMRPIDVSENNKAVVLKNLYGAIAYKQKHLVKKNSTVRVARQKHIFEKGSTRNFTDALFTVDEIVYQFPWKVYKLRDQTGKLMPSTYYPEEVSLVST